MVLLCSRRWRALSSFGMKGRCKLLSFAEAIWCAVSGAAIPVGRRNLQRLRCVLRATTSSLASAESVSAPRAGQSRSSNSCLCGRNCPMAAAGAASAHRRPFARAHVSPGELSRPPFGGAPRPTGWQRQGRAGDTTTTTTLASPNPAVPVPVFAAPGEAASRATPK